MGRGARPPRNIDIIDIINITSVLSIFLKLSFDIIDIINISPVGIKIRSKSAWNAGNVNNLGVAKPKIINISLVGIKFRPKSA